MAPRHLHIVGVDPGGTTGFAVLTVTRASMYDGAPYELWDFYVGELRGTEPQQVYALARKLREIQGLDYNIGPAVVVEDFDVEERTRTTDSDVLLSPVRLAAMIRYAWFLGQLGHDVRQPVMQPRTLAFETAPDHRLEAWGLYTEGSDHERDATRHAITMLRRARGKPELLDKLWADPARPTNHAAERLQPTRH